MTHAERLALKPGDRVLIAGSVHVVATSPVWDESRGWWSIGVGLSGEHRLSDVVGLAGSGYWIKRPCPAHSARFELECPVCNAKNAEWVPDEPNPAIRDQQADTIIGRCVLSDPAKCEACGLVSSSYVGIHVANGRLNLCRQCLSEINAKNPELKTLRNQLQAEKQAHEATIRKVAPLTPEQRAVELFASTAWDDAIRWWIARNTNPMERLIAATIREAIVAESLNLAEEGLARS